ncbi:MAG TPA: LysR family transcriptional regulator [Cellvibrio sp.]|nr:LysR family transcriptional regulator [Cellvibrio sp.]
MHYTLRQLQVFLAVAHYENVTKAAEHLAMSQSACSGALKDLETQYDVQLFDRVGKRLQTNELGRILRPKAEALIAMAQELEQDLKRHKEVGKIKVGATLTIGNYLAVPLISQFMQSNGAGVSLVVANTQAIAEKLLNFDIDIGMIEGEYHHPDLDIIRWQEDELICFCSPRHPLASKKTLTDADLTEAQWILREPGSGTRQAFERAMYGLLPQLRILLELQHTEGIKRAVENDMGISCLSQISLKDAFQRGSLVPLPVPQRDFHRMFYAVLHKHKYRSAGLLHWLDLCDINQRANLNPRG